MSWTLSQPGDCSIREAALKLKDWFKVGECKLSSPDEGKDSGEPVQVPRGIYGDKSDGEDGLYEVIIPRALSDDLEPVVVYRELFGGYRYFVAAAENFEQSSGPTFTLIKAL